MRVISLGLAAAIAVAGPASAQEEAAAAGAIEPAAPSAEVSEAPAIRMYEGESVVLAISELDSPPRYLRGGDVDRLPEVDALAKLGRGQRVTATAIVTKSGKLAEIELTTSSGVEELDRRIVEVLGGWQLSPGRKGGVAVHTQATFPWFLGKRPGRISGEEPVLSEEAKALGHHGKPVVAATIGADGVVRDPVIRTSSRSELIDADVLAAVRDWRFEPPIGFDGEPYDYDVVFGFDLMQAKEGGGSYITGMREYGCDAFNREYGWWLETRESDEERFEFKTFLLGALVILGMDKDGGAAGIVAGAKNFDLKWDKAVEQCKERPDWTFMKAFEKAK